MKILYLTQWFDPEPNVIKGPDFVRALERAGHEVTVVTGLPNYPTGIIYSGYKLRLYQRENLDGVSIIRLPLYPSHSKSSVGRGLNFLSFFVSVLCYGIVRGGRYDVAYVYHPPITVGLAAAILRPIRQLPFVLEIQDLWPDTVLESGMAGTSRVSSLLGWICNFVYRRARFIIVQSNSIKEKLKKRNVPEEKMSVIHNWADETKSAFPATNVSASCDGGKPFTFVYGGNFGRMQALECLVKAAKLGADAGGKFELLLFGDGVEAKALSKLALQINASNVRFHPRVSRTDARNIFATADVLVLHLADTDLLAATIPSKTQFYLSCGKPILAGVRGEAANILNDAGAAVVVCPGDVHALAKAMQNMSRMQKTDLNSMGLKGESYYNENFSFNVGVRKTLDVIENIFV